MPFTSEFDDIYKFGIKAAAATAGAYAERLDEQIFSEGMLDRIFNQIAKADVIVADMTGRNANVFYEVGYAHALGKVVLLVTRDSNDIPFDLKHHQHTVYGGSIDLLNTELTQKIEWGISEAISQSQQASTPHLSLHLMDISAANGATDLPWPVLDGTAQNASEYFNIPLFLRNESRKRSQEISHVYLLCESDTEVVPAIQGGTTTSFTIDSSGTRLPTKHGLNPPVPVIGFDALEVDAQFGLTKQFPLDLTFPSIPPSAVERAFLELMFTPGSKSCDRRFRLRLHSIEDTYDYCFRLQIKKE